MPPPLPTARGTEAFEDTVAPPITLQARDEQCVNAFREETLDF